LPATDTQGDPPMRKLVRPTIELSDDVRDRARGCLIGGAVGDALGAAVEFMSRAQIIERFGPGGIRDFVPAYGRRGAITDDTQMTLFTAEGIMRAYLRWSAKGICHPPSVIGYAYQRWLHTQGIWHSSHEYCLDGWLITNKELFAQRAPGRTCMEALRSTESNGTAATNNSKGCGGVMRVAPIGMYSKSGDETYDGVLYETYGLAVEAAALTHGHPTGQVAAGAFAVIVRCLMNKSTLPAAIDRCLDVIRSQESAVAETEHAILKARALAANRPGDPDAVAGLGGGWVAEEALAIGIYAALSAPTLEEGVVLAVNHSGDSDSTGAIAGNLLGAMHGASTIPGRWLDSLELRGVIEDVADDLASMTTWRVEWEDADSDYWHQRYPGG
jgi:ADP-ribosyl-[dinitrogen reductase] hydrolase